MVNEVKSDLFPFPIGLGSKTMDQLFHVEYLLRRPKYMISFVAGYWQSSLHNCVNLIWYCPSSMTCKLWLIVFIPQ